MSPNLTEAKEPSIELPELIADREVIVKKPGKYLDMNIKESCFIFWLDLEQLSDQKKIIGRGGLLKCLEFFFMSSSSP